MPDLTDATILATLVMAVVAGIKKAAPKLSGANTVIVAAIVALGLSWLWALRGEVTRTIACETMIRAVLGWLGAVTVSWGVRNPTRVPDASPPP